MLGSLWKYRYIIVAIVNILPDAVKLLASLIENIKEANADGKITADEFAEIITSFAEDLIDVLPDSVKPSQGE